MYVRVIHPCLSVSCTCPCLFRALPFPSPVPVRVMCCCISVSCAVALFRVPWPSVPCTWPFRASPVLDMRFAPSSRAIACLASSQFSSNRATPCLEYGQTRAISTGLHMYFLHSVPRRASPCLAVPRIPTCPCLAVSRRVRVLPGRVPFRALHTSLPCLSGLSVL